MKKAKKVRPSDAEAAPKEFSGSAIHNTPGGIRDSSATPNLVELYRDLYRTTARESHRQVLLANEFAAEHGHRVRYAPGLGWLVYDGTRWCQDEGRALVRQALMSTLRRLHREAVECGVKDLSRLVEDSQTNNALNSILEIAASLQGIASRVDEFDARPELLNMPNGTLDLHSGELLPHDAGHKLTKITRGSFDPAAPAKSDLWETFLNEVLPDPEVQRYLKQVTGIALFGAILEHILMVLTGTGRNGKGVAYGACSFALGDYADTADDGLFEVRRGGSAQGASPAIAKLRGVRYLVSSELEEKARIDASFMKRMTGGDRLSARFLYGQPFSFDPAFLALLVTNFLPKLPANDPAVWARVRVVPFDVVIPADKQDPQLPSKLKGCADAVLAWAVEGWIDYQKNGLVTPAAVTVATASYAESQDDVRRFVEEACSPAGLSQGFTASELHEGYTEWAKSENIYSAHVLGRTKFADALQRLGHSAKRTSRGMTYLLRVASDAPAYPPPTVVQQPPSYPPGSNPFGGPATSEPITFSEL